MYQATIVPDDVDVDAIAEDALQAAFKTIADKLEAAGYPVSGDFMPHEVSALEVAFGMYVRAMALNNPEIANLNADPIGVDRLASRLTDAERKATIAMGRSPLLGETTPQAPQGDADDRPTLCAYCGGTLFYSDDEDTWLHEASTDCGGSLCPVCGVPTFYRDGSWTHRDPAPDCFLQRTNAPYVGDDRPRPV